MQHERSPISSVPCQRNTWRFPNELGAIPAQHMKVPKRAQCHASAIHEGSRTSSETQKLLVQAIEETVRNVKFFLKANSVIEEQKSTVRFAGTCSWSDCISSPNISSFVGHGLMNGAVAPCLIFRNLHWTACDWQFAHTHTLFCLSIYLLIYLFLIFLSMDFCGAQLCAECWSFRGPTAGTPQMPV